MKKIIIGVFVLTMLATVSFGKSSFIDTVPKEIIISKESIQQGDFKKEIMEINNGTVKNFKLSITIADNERIIIVKNEDILNHKVIFDLDDPRISKIEIFVLSKEILNDLNIKLYAYHNNKEYIIDNKNFLDSNYLTYKMLNTNKERIEVGYKDDPNISSLKAENLIFIKISYTLAE